ncbi:hypothetical protein B0T21DRAFT_376799 [Apiosordaria backusii]|uniref:Uncharacterized protein n=1 Tax=Apiosordaria backusii TaxID=314023 RepID=A0AA40A7F0_9PEZI|nr:hypothetical protein B0T21DRAFT_376799 [Apiosordaria backusii]
MMGVPRFSLWGGHDLLLQQPQWEPRAEPAAVQSSLNRDTFGGQQDLWTHKKRGCGRVKRLLQEKRASIYNVNGSCTGGSLLYLALRFFNIPIIRLLL